MSEAAGVDIPDTALRSALEFAVDIAAAGQRLAPKLPVPAGLRPFLRTGTLPSQGLAKVRAAVESDDRFRTGLAAAMPNELVDEVGQLWLTRPDDWEQRVAELLAGRSPGDEDAATGRRERKRREAAEAAAERARREADDARADGQRIRAQLDDAVAARKLLERELADAKRAAREAERRASSAERERDRLAAAAASGSADVAALRNELDQMRTLLSRALGRPVESGVDVAALVQRIVEHQRTTSALVDELARAVRPPSRRRAPIPGRVAGDARAEAEYLMGRGGEVFVDGYNVAKTTWPDLALVDQRERCIALAEDVARRYGAMVAVIFDGADVPGATGTRRAVRVEYSPAGVSADDVIRARVAGVPASVPVVVVTNDQAIVRDVQALGAHTVRSEAFAALR